MADPIHQFEVQKIVDLPDITLPGIGRIDMAFTNSTLAMTIAFGVIVAFMARMNRNSVKTKEKYRRPSWPISW